MAPITPMRFGYTGGAQTHVIPPGVTEIRLRAAAASGGDGLVPRIGPIQHKVYQHYSSWAIGSGSLRWAIYPPEWVQGSMLIMTFHTIWDDGAVEPIWSLIGDTAGWTHVATGDVVSGMDRGHPVHGRGRVYVKNRGPGDNRIAIQVNDPPAGWEYHGAMLQVGCLLPPLGGGIRYAGGVVTDKGVIPPAGGVWYPEMPPMALSGDYYVMYSTTQVGGRPSNSDMTVGGFDGALHRYIFGFFNGPDLNIFYNFPPFSDTAGSFAPLENYWVRSGTGISDPIESSWIGFLLEVDRVPDIWHPRGGRGGIADIVLPVAPGDVITMAVAGAGYTSVGIERQALYPANGITGAVGVNGGGVPGGYTLVYRNGTLVLVVGGGGGAGAINGLNPWPIPHGGHGGNMPTDGQGPASWISGQPGTPGKAATTTSGGAPGSSRIIGVPSNAPFNHSDAGPWGGSGGGGIGRFHGGGGGSPVTNPNLPYAPQGASGGGGITWVNPGVGIEILNLSTGSNQGNGYVDLYYWGFGGPKAATWVVGGIDIDT